jgi:hypothetical protein
MNNDVVPYKLSNDYGTVTLLVAPYRGKYRTHPMMAAIIPDFMAHMTDLALKRVYQNLQIKINDMLLLEGWTDENTIFAYTETVQQNGKDMQIIKYSAPAYINHYEWMTNLFDEVTHETTHAVLRDYLKSYNNTTPSWWKEGLALQIAWPQGPSRAFAYYILKDYTVDQLVKKLNSGKIEADEYPEAFYAVDFIVKKYGWDAVRVINERLAGGEYFEDVIESILNVTMAQFYSMAANHARVELSKMNKVKEQKENIKKLRFVPVGRGKI